MKRLQEIQNRLEEFHDIPTTLEVEDLKWLVERVERLENENNELKSLCLWVIRRLQLSYKKFAYNEYEKITGDKPERL